jgi:hypothetical protein
MIPLYIHHDYIEKTQALVATSFAQSYLQYEGSARWFHTVYHKNTEGQLEFPRSTNLGCGGRRLSQVATNSEITYRIAPVRARVQLPEK